MRKSRIVKRRVVLVVRVKPVLLEEKVKHHETLTRWDIFSLYGCWRPMPRFLYWSYNDILYIILIIFMQQIPKILKESVYPPDPSILMLCSDWKWSTFFLYRAITHKVNDTSGLQICSGQCKVRRWYVGTCLKSYYILYWGIMKLLHKHTDWRKITEVSYWWVLRSVRCWPDSQTQRTRSMLTLLDSYDNIPMVNTRWNFLLPSVWTNLLDENSIYTHDHHGID